jgi:REP element-mobilizing transposase RayT
MPGVPIVLHMRLRLEQFHFYDDELETSRTQRNLPHWQQDWVCAFVTFRMADALPGEVMEVWLTERDEWLRSHGLDPEDHCWRLKLDGLPAVTTTAFHRTFTRRMHELLDAGHGSCLLRRAELRRIVENSLMRWHGERCLLAGWVIMPNHVHVLVQPMPGSGLLRLCESWKRWTARQINAAGGCNGHFWQAESWDHLLRKPVFLAKFREYIRQNPVKARLPSSDYTLWVPAIESLDE